MSLFNYFSICETYCTLSHMLRLKRKSQTKRKKKIAAAVYLSLRQRLLLQPDENIRPPLRSASRQLDDLPVLHSPLSFRP